MRGKNYLYVSCILLLFFLPQCEQEYDKYYEVPSDLIGTIVDVLKKDGNYSSFCKALEMVDYSDVIGKTGNFTAFVPNDSAFNNYLVLSGYNSLEDIPQEELRSVIMYHIVFWSYSRFKLLYGLGIEDENAEYSVLNFKKETRFKPAVSLLPDSAGRIWPVFNEYKYLYIFSNEYFEELNLFAEPNYTFLYPNSTFAGFHVNDARIIEYDIPAQNGWIHKIDKVLIPPDSHEDILNKRLQYSVFNKLLQNRASFTYNDAATRQQKGNGDSNNDGKLDSLFNKVYKFNSFTYSLLTENFDGEGQSRVLTLFAPTNEALQQFMTEHTTGYSSIFDFDRYWINWYLSHYIGYNYWPSQLASMTDHWSMPLASVTADGNIEPDNIVYNQLSSNGLFYGINKYLLPKSFETAAGPIFGNKEFSWFCELLVFYKVDILLNNEDIDYSVFAPTNQAMAAAGYSARDGLGGFGLYHSQNPLSPVPRSRALDLIKSHIVAQDMQEADFEDGTFLPTIQNTYIGVTDEGIFGGANALATPIGTALRSGVNGVVYPIQKMLLSPSSDLLQIISDQSSYPEFSEFYGLLQESGLITLDQSYSFALLSNLATGVRYTCLIPSNEAILEGKSSGVIPDDTEQLKQFLRYYFIDGTIFTDGEKSGSFKTTRYTDETHNIYSPITVINEKDNLRIQDNPGNIHQVISGNIMATNGVIHRISSLLIY